eukprot:5829484-Heterocapsa_arctica.AAC.1
MHRDPPVTLVVILVNALEEVHQERCERVKELILEMTVSGAIPRGGPRGHIVLIVRHEYRDQLGSHGGR